MADVVVTRRCPDCDEIKPATGFAKNRARADGLNSVCRVCANRRSREWAAAHPERVRARGLRWKERHPDGAALKQRRYRQYHPERVRAATALERQRQPDRVRARKKLNHAVKVGTVAKPGLCENCGRDGKLQAHHDDYANPLGVNWLCARCHKLHHLGAL